MSDPLDRSPAHGMQPLGPQVLLVAATPLAGLGTWHTLVQDFGLATLVAALLAVAQAAPLATALRWPTWSWTASMVALMGAATLVPQAPTDGLWPDPNLYVHLGVVFLAALRLGPAMWATMWFVLVGAGLVLTATSAGAITGSPGLAETVGLATAVVAVAGVLARTLQARDDALLRLAHQERAAQDERVRTAHLEERTRIARELHDVVAHHMAVVAMQAEAAPLRTPDDPDGLTKALRAIRTSAVDGLTELRRVVGVLRATDEPTTAPQPGLAEVVDLVDSVRATGLDVTLSVSGTRRPLPSGLELSAYRIVQEALNNVMRHAPTAGSEVDVRYLPDHLVLRITNTASPPAPTVPGAPGHGLLGMQERVTMFDGHVEAGPTPEGGYTVCAALPTGDGDPS